MILSRLARVSRLRIRSLLAKDKLDSELAGELAFHFDQLVRQNIASGMQPDQARIAARRLMGNTAVFQEQCRDERRVGWLQDLWRDVCYGVRMLRNNRGFTLVAAISLALGIGYNTAILAGVDAVLRGSLPYAETDRLVMIRAFAFEHPDQLANATLPDYFAWKAAGSFESIGASLADQKDLGEGEDGAAPEHLVGKLFSPELFPTLRIQPEMGRLFSETDYRSGERASTMLISHGLWQRRFGSDPAVLNKQVRLNGEPVTIIGIMPAYFPYSQDLVDYWLPTTFTRPSGNTQRYYIVTGRLRNGVTIAQAQAEMDAIAAQLAQDFPGRSQGWGVRVQPLRDFLYGWAKPPLLSLEAAVAFVLLIACANVAGLLLARGAVRRPEIAMRIALGASRGRIVRQLLTESVLLAMLGGVLGIVIAEWALKGIASMTPPPGAPRLTDIPISLDALAITALTSILTGLSFGLFPAFAAFKPDVAGSLKDGLRGAPYSTGHRVRGMLTAAQLALAFMLLIGFGLLMQSFVRLAGRNLNFDPNGILSVEFRIPQQAFMHNIGVYHDARYVEISPDPSPTLQRVYERLRQLPGGVSVAGSSFIPVNSLILASAQVIPEGADRTAGAPNGRDFTATYFQVTPNFFTTIRAPLVRGRDFDGRDTLAAPWVAVINEAAARRFWPDEDAIGKRFRLDIVPEERPREVVGIVRDIPTRSRLQVQPIVYLSYLQHPSRAGAFGNMYGGMTFLLRGPGDPMNLIPAVRQAVAEIEPDRPLANIATVQTFVGAAIQDFSSYVFVLGAFAFVATLLAAIGVYGIMTYSVAQRTREIAIRVALGATARDILALVGGRALLLISVGLSCGLLGALALGRLIASQLWGIGANDPATFEAVAVLLASVALVACFEPARRALRVDPAAALRND